MGIPLIHWVQLKRRQLIKIVQAYNLQVRIKNYSKMKRNDLITEMNKHMELKDGKVHILPHTEEINVPQNKQRTYPVTEETEELRKSLIQKFKKKKLNDVSKQLKETTLNDWNHLNIANKRAVVKHFDLFFYEESDKFKSDKKANEYEHEDDDDFGDCEICNKHIKEPYEEHVKKMSHKINRKKYLMSDEK